MKNISKMTKEELVEEVHRYIDGLKALQLIAKDVRVLRTNPIVQCDSDCYPVAIGFVSVITRELLNGSEYSITDLSKAVGVQQ